MPASEILAKFHAGTLHSGKGGPIVTNPHQAKAIQLSYLRKEGHNIPFKKGGKRKSGFASMRGRKR
jgi:hypothetical protein